MVGNGSFSGVDESDLEMRSDDRKVCLKSDDLRAGFTSVAALE